MDELACFAPGMIALGSSGYDSEEAKKFLTLAEEVKKSFDHFPLWNDEVCLFPNIRHSFRTSYKFRRT